MHSLQFSIPHLLWCLFTADTNLLLLNLWHYIYPVFCYTFANIEISTLNMMANVYHTWLYKCASYVMWKELKLSSDSDNFGIKIYDWSYGDTCDGVRQSLCLVRGIWSQVVSFALVCLRRIWLQLAWRCFHI